MKLRDLGRQLHLLHRGEQAQGMVFGAISLFMLAACVGLVHNSGVVTSRRIQTQTAADAAAYAGSLVSANIISDVAWMNDSMAYIYYNLMRHAVDVTVCRTVAEIGDHNKNKDPDIYIDPLTYSPDYRRLVNQMGGDPVGAYLEAYQLASETIQQGEEWLDILSRMERALAISGKYLVREAICKTAAEQGNEVAAVAMLQTDPTGTVFMHRSNVVDIDMIIEYNPDGQPLWRITYNGQPYMEIYKHGPNHWEIVRPGVQSVDIFRHSDSEWTIKTGDMVTDIKRYPNGTLEVTVSGEETAHLLAIPMDDGQWAVFGQTGGSDISYEPMGDGGYRLTVNGNTTRVREQDGKMQEFTNGQWEDIYSGETIDVGGEEVPVNFNNHIDLPGNASLDFPNRLNLGPITFTMPDQISFAGTDITLGSDSVKITARVGNVGLVIDGDKDNCVTLNGRSTCDPNSSNKRGYWVQGVYGHDRIETLVPGRKWVYKWRKIRSIFTSEYLDRFGYHAVVDAELTTRGENDWAHIEYSNREGWFNVATGARRNLTAYHQTVPCWRPSDLQGSDAPVEPDGFIQPPTFANPDGNPCSTCNPEYYNIDYDQRFEDAIDNDGDGLADVRKYGVNTRLFRTYISQEDEREYQEVLVGGNARPLCLTESVFAHPLLVAVWIRPDAPFLGRRVAPPLHVYQNRRGDIQAQRTGPSRWIPFFRNPDWGYFAVACSRVGVLDNSTAVPYRFTFDDAADLRYDFDFGQIEFEARLDARQEWLDSWHNLYEPVWTARLWSTSETVKSVDMEIANRQRELGQWEEVSKNFVWRMLQGQSPWIDPNSAEIIEPDYVAEARRAFHRMRGPHSGPFHVSMETSPDQLQEALRH